MQKIVVETGARIHLGFYGLRPSIREFGGVGLYVDDIGFRIEITKSDTLSIEGCQAGRVSAILNEVVDVLGLRNIGVKIRLSQCIPEHRGLGSTTQLKLSVASAIAKMYNLSINLEEVARKLNIAKISGIGLYSFKYGGFIIDAGKRSGNDIVKLLARYEFPENWYVLVLIPLVSRRIDEEKERILIRQVSPLPEREYCRGLEIVFRKMVPALIEKDFSLFTEAVEELDTLTSKYFSPVQGKRFCCKELDVIHDILKNLGVEGIGQSSWGPSLYAFFDNKRRAEEALKYVKEEASRRHIELEFARVVPPRNVGAIIKVG